MASEYALLTLSELRTFPGLKSVNVTAENDAILDALVDGVTASFEEYWRTYGVRRSVTERHTYESIRRNSRDANAIYLRKPPVVPSGITIADPADNSISSDDYWVEQTTGVLHTTGAWGVPQNDAGFQTYWEITYTGGHFVNAAAVPGVAKAAAKMYAANIYQRPDKDLTRKRVGDLELGYRDTKEEPDLPQHIKAMISPWKIHWV